MLVYHADSQINVRPETPIQINAIGDKKENCFFLKKGEKMGLQADTLITKRKYEIPKSVI